ncbi:hypothetical protein ABJC17_09290, partial [Bifidobacterium adolescentis]
GAERHNQEPFSGFWICSTWPLIVLNILNMSLTRLSRFPTFYRCTEARSACGTIAGFPARRMVGQTTSLRIVPP